MLLAFSEGKLTHFTSCSVLDGSSRFIRTVPLALTVGGTTRLRLGLMGEVASKASGHRDRGAMRIWLIDQRKLDFHQFQWGVY
jgi:hypothetical protein